MASRHLDGRRLGDGGRSAVRACGNRLPVAGGKTSCGAWAAPAYRAGPAQEHAIVCGPARRPLRDLPAPEQLEQAAAPGRFARERVLRRHWPQEHWPRGREPREHDAPGELVNSGARCGGRLLRRRWIMMLIRQQGATFTVCSGNFLFQSRRSPGWQAMSTATTPDRARRRALTGRPTAEATRCRLLRTRRPASARSLAHSAMRWPVCEWVHRVTPHS